MPRADTRNSTRYWWDRHLRGLSLMHADFTTHAVPPHSHEAFGVAVTELGGSIIRSRGTVEEAQHSRLFVFNPAEPHAGWMGWSRHWLYRALEDGRDPLRERELLIGSFGELFRRHGSGGERIAPAQRDRAALAKAVELMRARYGEKLRLEEIAAAIGLSTFQLIGVFKHATGLTPHAYLTQIRLGAACRHLRRGRPIAEAALACGFYDQSALHNHFKRCYAMTPLQFAKAAAG